MTYVSDARLTKIATEAFVHIVTYVGLVLAERLYTPGSSSPAYTRRIAALRRYTYQAWLTSCNEVDQRRLLERCPSWGLLLTCWKKLGTHIPEEGRDGDEPAFPSLERCGWAECACSVLKPTHRLRVCKRCWVVAYCGTKCQRRCVLTRTLCARLAA